MRGVTGAAARTETRAGILDAVSGGPLTTAEIAEIVEGTSKVVSRELYAMLDAGEIQRVLGKGEIVWASLDYRRPVESRPRVVYSLDDEEEDLARRRKRSPEERRALVAAAVEAGPKSQARLEESLQMTGLGPVLRDLRDDGIIQKTGTGQKTQWVTAGWEAPERVVSGLRPHTRQVMEEPARPTQQPSWWAISGMTRERWYAEAKTAGERLTISKGKVPFSS